MKIPTPFDYYNNTINEINQRNFGGNSPYYDMSQEKEYKNEKLYDLYEMKNLTAEEMREGYREITGLDNDGEFTDDELYEYLLDALYEKHN